MGGTPGSTAAKATPAFLAGYVFLPFNIFLADEYEWEFGHRRIVGEGFKGEHVRCKPGRG
jgi:hypothetical protein